MIEDKDLIELRWLTAQVERDIRAGGALRRAFLALGNYRLACVEDGYEEVIEVDCDPPWDWLNPPPSRRTKH